MTWQTEFDEKLSRYIKNINVGQYDDAGVFIGFEKAKNIIKAFIQDLLNRKVEETTKQTIKDCWYEILELPNNPDDGYLDRVHLDDIWVRFKDLEKRKALSIMKE